MLVSALVLALFIVRVPLATDSEEFLCFLISVLLPAPLLTFFQASVFRALPADTSKEKWRSLGTLVLFFLNYFLIIFPQIISLILYCFNYYVITILFLLSAFVDLILFLVWKGHTDKLLISLCCCCSRVLIWLMVAQTGGFIWSESNGDGNDEHMVPEILRIKKTPSFTNIVVSGHHAADRLLIYVPITSFKNSGLAHQGLFPWLLPSLHSEHTEWPIFSIQCQLLVQQIISVDFLLETYIPVQAHSWFYFQFSML